MAGWRAPLHPPVYRSTGLKCHVYFKCQLTGKFSGYLSCGLVLAVLALDRCCTVVRPPCRPPPPHIPTPKPATPPGYHSCIGAGGLGSCRGTPRPAARGGRLVQCRATPWHIDTVRSIGVFGSLTHTLQRPNAGASLLSLTVALSEFLESRRNQGEKTSGREREERGRERERERERRVSGRF